LSHLLGSDVLDRALTERTEANRALFEAESERLARLCHRMAERFARGGRLIALGRSPAARSDARPVAVEFVHPVRAVRSWSRLSWRSSPATSSSVSARTPIPPSHSLESVAP
jgi:D-sedoheptulose 7-phosphate isomerase